MTTQFYVDAGGNYLGAWDDASASGVPQGAVAVPSAPDHVLQIWSGTAWSAIPAATTAFAQLHNGDGNAFRLLEVLVDVLLAKGVIVGTDFPLALRQLYQARKALRSTAGVP